MSFINIGAEVDPEVCLTHLLAVNSACSNFYLDLVIAVCMIIIVIHTCF